LGAYFHCAIGAIMSETKTTDFKRAETLCVMIDEVLKFCSKRCYDDKLIVAKKYLLDAKINIEEWIKENK
jgi:hypothetical protein